jgi:NAD(P)-dependent dehydrogenase (short-subunit alcohol dehydrogenase family)
MPETEERRVGRLDGKVALISGGSSGIGLATAKRFVAEGANVFIIGRREAELDAAVKDIGKNIKALKGDVSNLGDLDRIWTRNEQCLRGDEGSRALVCANLDDGFEAASHSGERHQPRLDRYARIGRVVGFRPGGRRAPKDDLRRNADGSAWHAR